MTHRNKLSCAEIDVAMLLGENIGCGVRTVYVCCCREVIVSATFHQVRRTEMVDRRKGKNKHSYISLCSEFTISGGSFLEET